MKKEKSVKFMKLSLQLLALQFPHITIRYGLGGVFRNLHLVQLTPEAELTTNKSLSAACMAISEAFDARFGDEDAFFTIPESELCIKEPIIEFNKDIDEYERLHGDFPRKTYPPLVAGCITEPVVEKAACKELQHS